MAALRHVTWKSFTKVIGAQMLNFKPVFKCLFLKIVRGLSSPVGYALASLGQSLARVKKLRGQQLLGAGNI